MAAGRLHARWFHGERFADSLAAGVRVALFGKVELDRATGGRVMVQPEIEILVREDEEDEALHTGRIVAVYEAAGKVSTRIFRQLLDRILKQVADARRRPARRACARRQTLMPLGRRNPINCTRLRRMPTCVS